MTKENLPVGQIVTGIVVELKSDKIKIKLSEEVFGEIEPSEIGDLRIQTGDKLDVYLEDVHDSNASISYERGIYLKAWEKLYNDYKSKTAISGLIERKLNNDLGYAVMFDGVRTWLPRTTLSGEQEDRLNIGNTYKFIVTKFDKKMGDIEVKLVE